MIPANEHHCPVCGSGTIPIWRAMCKNCYEITPLGLRGKFIDAYHRRVLHNPHYQESLIEARQWFLRVEKHRREGVE